MNPKRIVTSALLISVYLSISSSFAGVLIHTGSIPLYIPSIQYSPLDIKLTMEKDFIAVSHKPAVSLLGLPLSYTYNWLLYPQNSTDTSNPTPIVLPEQTHTILSLENPQVAQHSFGKVGVRVNIQQQVVFEEQTFDIPLANALEIPESALSKQAQFVTDTEYTGLEGMGGGLGLTTPEHFKSFDVEILLIKKKECVDRDFFNTCTRVRVYTESYFPPEEKQTILTAFYILSNNLFAFGEKYKFAITECTIDRYSKEAKQIYGTNSSEYLEAMTYFEGLTLFVDTSLETLWERDPLRVEILEKVDSAWWKGRKVFWDKSWQSKALSQLITLGQAGRISNYLDQGDKLINQYLPNLEVPSPLRIYIKREHAQDMYETSTAIVNTLINTITRSNYIENDLRNDFVAAFTKCFDEEFNEFGFY